MFDSIRRMVYYIDYDDSPPIKDALAESQKDYDAGNVGSLDVSTTLSFIDSGV